MNKTNDKLIINAKKFHKLYHSIEADLYELIDIYKLEARALNERAKLNMKTRKLCERLQERIREALDCINENSK